MLRKMVQTPLVHYLLHGYRELRNPHPQIDIGFIIEQVDSDLTSKGLHNEPVEILLNNTTKLRPSRFFERKLSKEELTSLFNDGVSLDSIKDDKFNVIENNILKEFTEGNKGGRTKLILTSHNATRTGAPLIILKLGELLKAKYNYDITVILGEGGELLEDFKAIGPTLDLGNVVGHDLWQWEDSLLDRVLKKTLKMKYDIAVCNSAESFKVISTLKKIGVPILSLIHEFPYFYSKNIIENIHLDSNHIVYPSNLVSDSISEYLDEEPKNTSIIPQGLFDESFPKGNKKRDYITVRKELGIPDDYKIILGSGTVDYRKGCDLFVQTAIKLFQDNPDIKVCFVWLGKLGASKADLEFQQWLRQDLKMAEIEDKVKFIGSRDVVDNYFNAADVFLLTSRLDPFPCVVLEALAAELPVIFFDKATGSVDVLDEGISIKVPYLSTSELVHAIKGLIWDEEKLNVMGKSASDKVERKYLFDEYVNKINEIITSEYK